MRSRNRLIFEGRRMNNPILLPHRAWPWGPVARSYTPRGFKAPTKPTLKVGGARQNISDLTLTVKKFPDMVHQLNNIAKNI
jgi:hypothetical protein